MDKTTALALDQQARDILRMNDRGRYTVPTDGLYPYQWNWDSAFAALGLAALSLPRAWLELETLMAGQWDNGMVPHIQFHQPNPGYFHGPEIWGCEGHGPVASSGISQPPVAASVALWLYRMDPQLGREHLRALMPRFARWHRWFMRWRNEDGAICVTHPWESGRDNAPDWDGPMAAITPTGVGSYQRRDTAHVDPHMRPTKYDYDRYIWLVQLGRRLNWDEGALARENPFRVADPTMTFILLRACRDLGEMVDELGEVEGVARGEIDDWVAQLSAGAQSLWNPDIAAFDARDIRSGQFAGSISNASFLCWYGGLDSAEMRAHLERLFARLRYGVPSSDPDSATFDPARYWRGPVWAMMNTLIGIGLGEMGHGVLASQVRTSSQALIEAGGFGEYFNPENGAPAGGGVFTWTAAVWLGWISPNAEDL